MKLIICFNCYSAFTPSGEEKKCNCEQTSASYIDKVIHYSGDNAFAVDLDSPATMNLLSTYKDLDAVKRNHDDIKKEKKERDKLFCTKVLEYLNDKADTGHSLKFPSSNTTLILQRRDEHKCTLEDFKRVIDNKVIQWKGKEMETFLRPSTLFGKTNFINYIGERTGIKQSTGSSFEKLRNTASQAKDDILGGGEED